MKIQSSSFKILTILFAAVLLISACSSQQKLIGAWSDANGNLHEFTSGGVYIITFRPTR